MLADPGTAVSWQISNSSFATAFLEGEFIDMMAGSSTQPRSSFAICNIILVCKSLFFHGFILITIFISGNLYA